jgi:hypothetical protein
MPQTRPSFYMYTLYKLTVCTCLKDHNKDNDLICMNYLLLDVKQQTLIPDRGNIPYSALHTFPVTVKSLRPGQTYFCSEYG